MKNNEESAVELRLFVCVWLSCAVFTKEVMEVCSAVVYLLPDWILLLVPLAAFGLRLKWASSSY